MRFVKWAVVVLVAGYGSSTALLYWAMRQPPEKFGAIMKHVPAPAMIALPFRPLWMSARAGEIAVGSPAPDFTLPELHGDTKVRLSEAYASRPVVLVFGSYT